MTEHTHHHEQHHPKSHVSKVLQRTIVGGNIGIGIAEALTAGSASAVWSDFGHNIADAYVYNEQLNNVREPDSPKATNYKRRKTMYTILSVSSAALAIKSGVDLAWDNDTTADPLAIYTAGASVVFNGGIGIARYRQMRQQQRERRTHSHHDHDVNKHLAVDSASAGLAFVGAVAGASTLGPIAGIVSGMIGAKLFFPSEKNLRHSYHAHGEEDKHTHEHVHHDLTEQLPQQGVLLNFSEKPATVKDMSELAPITEPTMERRPQHEARILETNNPKQVIDAMPYYRLGMILGPDRTRPPLQNVIAQYRELTDSIRTDTRPNIRTFDQDTVAFKTILAETLHVDPQISMQQLRETYPDFEGGINPDQPRELQLAYAELKKLVDPDEMKEHRDEIKGDILKAKLRRYTRPLVRPFKRNREEPKQPEPQAPKTSRWKKLVAAGTAAVALGGAFGVMKATQEERPANGNQIIATAPEQPTQQGTEQTPNTLSVISAPETVQEGQSLWKVIRSDVSEIQSEHKRGVTSVATKFAAFDNELANANQINPNKINPGQYKILDQDSLMIISDALDNPPGRHAAEGDKHFAENVKAWADSGIPYDQLVQNPDEQQRFHEILDYLKAQRSQT